MSAKKASQVYESFVKGKIYLTDIKTSEIVKLVENTFRDVNLAFSNELKKICLEYGIDVWEVIEMANRHPRVNVLNPGPGVGGHCIPIDPWFLVENIGSDTPLIKSARRINDSMPFEVLRKIEYITEKIGSPVISLLGASYKENVGDTRESPTEKIHEELQKKNIDVRVCDPISENYKYQLKSFEEAVKGSDLVVLLVGHDQFREISFSGLSSNMRNKNILDTRNFFKREEIEKNGFRYYTA
jgi:UDP-N-acetyl-D-mannosaminuronic acid dehydrogenase